MTEGVLLGETVSPLACDAGLEGSGFLGCTHGRLEVVATQCLRATTINGTRPGEGVLEALRAAGGNHLLQPVVENWRRIFT